jgi:hypothetical protein
VHVKEIPLTIFNEMVPDPEIINVRDYAMEQDYHKPHYYPDKLVVIGQIEPDIFICQGLTSVYTYLSLHGSRNACITADTVFDTHFSLMAGSKDGGSWMIGRGTLVHENIWTYNGRESYMGAEELGKYARISAVAGKIALRAKELLESGVVDATSYFSGDIDPENPL